MSLPLVMQVAPTHWLIDLYGCASSLLQVRFMLPALEQEIPEKLVALATDYLEAFGPGLLKGKPLYADLSREGCTSVRIELPATKVALLAPSDEWKAELCCVLREAHLPQGQSAPESSN